MPYRHRVFISYHHAEDQLYKERFTGQFSEVMIDWSVRLGDISEDLSAERIRQKIRDEWLRDSTVTVVLVGRCTWQRRHVDWEIGSSLRDTQRNPRSGLLGVLLPTATRLADGRPDLGAVPPRLVDNLGGDDPFARLIEWPADPATLRDEIHCAFLRRHRDPPPDNTRASFRRCRSGDRWTDAREREEHWSPAP